MRAVERVNFQLVADEESPHQQLISVLLLGTTNTLIIILIHLLIAKIFQLQQSNSTD